VVCGACRHGVSTAAGHHDIVSAVARNGVGETITENQIIACAGNDEVGSVGAIGAADERVVAVTAHQWSGPAAAILQIVAKITLNHVVSATATYGVVAALTNKGIVAVAAARCGI
jgi:hypothetical protein